MPQCTTSLAVTRVSVHSYELSTICHCSQANECELRWKWHECGEFGLYNSIKNRNPKKYKRPIHYQRLIDWKSVPNSVPSQLRHGGDPRRRTLIVIGIDTNIEVVVVSLTTWEAHHSPRAKPEPSGCGGLPRWLMRQQWPKLRYQFLFYHD